MMGHRIRAQWFPAIVIGLYGLLVLSTLVEEQWRPEWDSAIYMLTARSLAEGTGYTYLDRPFFLRPPGFSYALSFLVDDGRFDFAQLNFLMMLAAVAAVGAVYLALRRTEGSNWALFATLLLATCPLFVARFNWIESDLPFLALFFASILLFDLATRSSTSPVPACLGGSLLLTAALYVRSAGILLLPGVVVLMVLQRPSTEATSPFDGLRANGAQRDFKGVFPFALSPSKGVLALVPIAIVFLLYGPWLLHVRSAAANAQTPSEQLLLFDYPTATFRIDPGDPSSPALSAAQLLQRIRTNAFQIVADLAGHIFHARSGWAYVLVVVLLSLGFVAALIRGPTLLEWHAVTYTALLLAYFVYDARLLLPLLPVVYAYLVRGLDRIRLLVPLGANRTAAGLRIGIAAVAFAGFTLLNLASLPRALDPGSSPMPVGTLGDTWDDYQRSADWLRENTPADARIMTEMAPIISLLSNRQVYTNRFPRQPDMVHRYQIDYVATFWWSDRVFTHGVAQSAERDWVLSGHAPDWPIHVYKVAGRS